jgi:hypothetical protein
MLVNNWQESFYKYSKCCIWIPTFKKNSSSSLLKITLGPAFVTLDASTSALLAVWGFRMGFCIAL